MFVVSKRNILLPGPDGESFRMAKDYMGPLPAWAEDSAYLKALAEDGKVVLSAAGGDRDFARKEKKSKKGKPQEEKPEEPEAPPENPDDAAE